MTDNMLRKICADKREHVERLKRANHFVEVDAAARCAPPLRPFAPALRSRVNVGDIGFIAEIKKASPSAGVIRANFSPPDIARSYAAAGAACLSVLTDEPYFQGRNDDLVSARAACDLPVLRKDFMIDVWQVAEARAIGADCILLIMAALDDDTARDLHAAATDYGMDVLIEVHDENELQRALNLPSGLLGINNRNLKTLKTDLAVTERLSRLVPPGKLAVSESGIASADDIERIRSCGIHCFLIGESLLKQDNTAAALTKLRK